MCVEFTANLDNGHDCFQFTDWIDLSEDDLACLSRQCKNESDHDSEVVTKIVREITKKYHKKHGKSYPAYCVGLSISPDEEDRQIDNGNAEIINDQLVCSKGYEWLSYYADSSVIQWAFEVETR